MKKFFLVTLIFVVACNGKEHSDDIPPNDHDDDIEEGSDTAEGNDIDGDDNLNDDDEDFDAEYPFKNNDDYATCNEIVYGEDNIAAGSIINFYFGGYKDWKEIPQVENGKWFFYYAFDNYVQADRDYLYQIYQTWVDYYEEREYDGEKKVVPAGLWFNYGISTKEKDKIILADWTGKNYWYYWAMIEKFGAGEMEPPIFRALRDEDGSLLLLSVSLSEWHMPYVGDFLAEFPELGKEIDVIPAQCTKRIYEHNYYDTNTGGTDVIKDCCDRNGECLGGLAAVEFEFAEKKHIIGFGEQNYIGEIEGYKYYAIESGALIFIEPCENNKEWEIDLIIYRDDFFVPFDEERFFQENPDGSGSFHY
ncbi:MAG: hypothetical protein Kow0090_10030 [Myxococcota bacterium]